MQFLTSVPRGMQESAQIIFFIFIIGGSFAVLQESRAIEAGVGAQGIAELPILSGREYRIVMCIAFFILTTACILRYANKVKKDPKKSCMYDFDRTREDIYDLDNMQAFGMMAALALAKIPWSKWAKWILPLIGLQYALGAVFVVIAQMIGLGPF